MLRQQNNQTNKKNQTNPKQNKTKRFKQQQIIQPIIATNFQQLTGYSVPFGAIFISPIGWRRYDPIWVTPLNQEKVLQQNSLFCGLIIWPSSKLH